MTFVRKIRTFNVDEIDGWTPAYRLFRLYSPMNYHNVHNMDKKRREKKLGGNFCFKISFFEI